MNHWHIEVMAELERENIQKEMKQIRLAEEAAGEGVHCRNWFEGGMMQFGNWMITTGRYIHHRYEVPAVHCNQASTGSFAR